MRPRVQGAEALLLSLSLSRSRSRVLIVSAPAPLHQASTSEPIRHAFPDSSITVPVRAGTDTMSGGGAGIAVERSGLGFLRWRSWGVEVPRSTISLS